jgi:hypothetical protein
VSKLWTFGDSLTFGYGCRKINDDETSSYNLTYSNYIDLTKQTWSEYVSSKLNIELLNCGINGVSNDYILDNILNQFFNFKKEDIIIIQTSTSARHDFPFFKKKKLMGGWYKENQDDIYDINDNSPYFFKTIFNTNIIKEYEDGGENTLLHSTTENNTDNLKLSKIKYETIQNFFTEFISTKKYYERQIWRFIKICDILKSMNFNVFVIHEDYWPKIYKKPNYVITTSDDGLLQQIIRDGQTILQDTNGKIVDYHPSYKGHITIGENILKKINENINLYNT